MDQPGHASATSDGGGHVAADLPARCSTLILAHRTTIIFVNSRRLAERVAQQLTELAVARGVVEPGVELVRAHHGSVARHQRARDRGGAQGRPAARDHRDAARSSSASTWARSTSCVQVESPGAVSRGLQRIGRAGHHVGGTSIGRIFPKFRGDLLEATVVARGMLDGEVEAIRVPDSALDVLAQQIVAMVAVEPWPVDRARARGPPRRELSRASRGRARRRARHAVGPLSVRRVRRAAPAPDVGPPGRRAARAARRAAAQVVVGRHDPRPRHRTRCTSARPARAIGELDEEMVAESRKGETFILGATTWRIEDITRDRVIVSPAPGEPGKMPFWRGDGPGRPVELGRALGAFCRELDARLADDPAARARVARARLPARRARGRQPVAYLAEQRAQTGALPTDRAITIERFRDELGDVARVHPDAVRRPRARAVGARARAPAREPARLPGAPAVDRRRHRAALRRRRPLARRRRAASRIPTTSSASSSTSSRASSVFASHFRENAARALLLPRRRPGQRTPLWAQRLRAQQLMGVALRFPAFPITLETYREVLRDVFDCRRCVDVLRAIRGARDPRRVGATTDGASPFARSLVFDYVAAFLYEGDAPLAERKAQALTLDRELLRELIGGGELRELLDLGRARRGRGRAAAARRRSAARATLDEVHDLLRRLGDLDAAEIAARCERRRARRRDRGARRRAPHRARADRRRDALHRRRGRRALSRRARRRAAAGPARGAARTGADPLDVAGRALRAHARAVHGRRPSPRAGASAGA